MKAIAQALTSLNALAGDAWRDLTRHCGATDLVRQVGWLKVFEDTRTFERAAPSREIERACGHRIDELSSDELRQLEPNLAPIFKHASINWECSFILEPIKITTAMAHTFLTLGGRIEQTAVKRLEESSGVLRIVCDGSERTADMAVLAAGAWSAAFLKDLGVRPKLDSERGYHLMFPTPERSIGRPTVNMERHFVLSPMQSGLRMTSGEEFAGLEAPPDYRRIKRLLPEARRMLPTLETEVLDSWLGRRPSTPESLPVIGVAPRLPRVLCAFGHGHLGMTQGPASGRVIADLVAGRDPRLDLSPFSPGR